ASSIPQVRPLSVRSGLSASPIWLIGDESSADRVAAMPHGTNERQSSSECASDGGGAEAACRALPQPPDSSCRCQNGHLPRNGIEVGQPLSTVRPARPHRSFIDAAAPTEGNGIVDGGEDRKAATRVQVVSL